MLACRVWDFLPAPFAKRMHANLLSKSCNLVSPVNPVKRSELTRCFASLRLTRCSASLRLPPSLPLMSPFGLPAAGYPASARWHVFAPAQLALRANLRLVFDLHRPRCRALRAAFRQSIFSSPELAILDLSQRSRLSKNSAR